MFDFRKNEYLKSIMELILKNFLFLFHVRGKYPCKNEHVEFFDLISVLINIYFSDNR